MKKPFLLKLINVKSLFIIPVIVIFIIVLILGKQNFQNGNGWFGDMGFTMWVLDSNYKYINGDKQNFTDSSIFYPYSDSLYYSEHLVSETIIGLPVYLLTKSTLMAYNFTFIISFYISFVGMFSYLLYKFKSVKISFVLAILFTFNTFILNHLGHYQLLFIGFLPFSVLFFEKIVSNEGKKRNYLGFGLFTTLLMLSNIYYLIFTVLFGVFYFIPRYIYKLAWKVKRNNIFMLLTLVAVLPIIILFSYKYLEVSNYLAIERNISEVTSLSSDVLNILLPNNQAPLYSNSVLSKLSPESLNKVYALFQERSLYWGSSITILILLGVFSIKLIGKIKKEISLSFILDEKLHIIIVIALIILICLGPIIKFAGLTVDVITPYDIVRKLFPFITSLRAISRFFVYAIFLAIVLAGFGLQKLEHYFKEKYKGNIIFMIILVLVLAFTYLDTYSFGMYLTNNLSLNQNVELNKDLKINGINNIYFFPDINNTSVLSNRIPFFDVSVTSMLLLMEHKNIKMMNGYSGIFPPDLWKFNDYVEKYGFSKSILYALNSIGIDTIIVRKSNIKDSVLTFYENTLKSAVNENLLTIVSNEGSSDKVYKINNSKLNEIGSAKIIKSQTVNYLENNLCSLVLRFTNNNNYGFGQKEKKEILKISLTNRVVSVSIIEPIFIPENESVEIIRKFSCAKDEVPVVK